MRPYVHCSVIFNNQDLETAQVLTSRWIDLKNKKTVQYIYTLE